MAVLDCVYRLTGKFPDDERLGLAMKMRLAAIGIPEAIADGSECTNAHEFLRFLAIARQSLRRVDTQVRVAQNLGYCDGSAILKRIESSSVAIGSLMKSLCKS